jgi:hypothetical protein
LGTLSADPLKTSNLQLNPALEATVAKQGALKPTARLPSPPSEIPDPRFPPAFKQKSVAKGEALAATAATVDKPVALRPTPRLPLPPFEDLDLRFNLALETTVAKQGALKPTARLPSPPSEIPDFRFTLAPILTQRPSAAKPIAFVVTPETQWPSSGILNKSTPTQLDLLPLTAELHSQTLDFESNPVQPEAMESAGSIPASDQKHQESATQPEALKPDSRLPHFQAFETKSNPVPPKAFILTPKPQLATFLDFNSGSIPILARRQPEPADPATLYTPEACIDQLSEEEILALDREFPYLGLALALHTAKLRAQAAQAAQAISARAIFDSPLTAFNPNSGSCRNMKLATVKSKTYVLKDKNTMGLRGCSSEQSQRKAANEIAAGILARQRIVDIFCKNGKNLSKMQQKLGFFKCLVLPVDCGDYIASSQVPNANPLGDIVFSPINSSSKSSDQSHPTTGRDVPLPDFDPPMTLRDHFPNMNFGRAIDRINAIENIIKIINFLHTNGIAHNDLHAGNLLISNNNYRQPFLIDFDQATQEQEDHIRGDWSKLIETILEYYGFRYPLLIIQALRTGQPPNWSVRDDGIFSYTPEELIQITEQLQQLLRV